MRFARLLAMALLLAACSGGREVQAYLESLDEIGSATAYVQENAPGPLQWRPSVATDRETYERTLRGDREASARLNPPLHVPTAQEAAGVEAHLANLEVEVRGMARALDLLKPPPGAARLHDLAKQDCDLALRALQLHRERARLVMDALATLPPDRRAAVPAEFLFTRPGNTALHARYKDLAARSGALAAEVQRVSGEREQERARLAGRP